MIEIKVINNQEIWNNYIGVIEPHSFLHAWEWTELQEKLGNKIFRLGLFESAKLVGLIFVYIINAKRGSFLFCPNGPLIDWNNNSHLNFVTNYLILLAKKNNVDVLRISPIVIFSDDINAKLKKIGFIDAPIHVHQEISWILDITKNEDELLQNMKKNTRYSIKKAINENVKITSSALMSDFDIFYKMNLQTVQREQYVPFSKEHIQNEFEIFSKNNKSLVYIAYYNEIPISSAVIIFSNGSAFYHYGASVRDYKGIPASELLHWQVILDSKKMRLKYYNFWGIAPENKINHPWRGLTKFKQGFGGFAEKYVPTQDIPLTKWYFVIKFIENIRKIKRGY